MDMLNYDTESGTYRDASTVELRGSNGKNDMEYSFLDYVFRGTASAATSAAVGIANTGVAFGEMLGVADEENYIDEGDAVDAVWGEETGEFYRQHKVGIDAAGMVGGSFVPGLAAVKALRLAQKAGKIPAMTRLKTGMKEPDILLSSRALETAKQSVYSTNVTGVANPQVLRAYSGGVGQAFMESAAFDIGVVAAMNQNATLNPEDLGFLESSKNVFIESLPFTFLGGALGGGLEILKAKGSIAKWVDAEVERTGEFRVPDIATLQDRTPGDKLMALAETASAHNTKFKQISTDDTNAKNAWQRGHNQVQQNILDVSEELGVKSKAQLEVITELMEKGGAGETENVAKILSGLTSINKITATDFSELSRFYDKVKGPTGIIRGSNFEEIATQVADRQTEFKNILNNMGLDDYTESMAPERFAFRMAGEGEDAAGFAATGGRAADDNIRVNYINIDGKQTGFVPDFANLNPEKTRQAWEFNKRYNKIMGQEYTQSLEEFENYVFLHELGHVKSNSAKLLNFVQNSMAVGTNKKAFTDLVRASVRSRKENWATSMRGGPRKSEDELVGEVVDFFENPRYDEDGIPGWVNYLGDPKELLADGAAYFTREETRQIASKQMPELAKIFDQAGSVAKSWSDTKAFYNFRTKKSLSSAMPGINDLSPNAQIKNTKTGTFLNVPEMGKSYKRNGDYFNTVKNQIDEGKFDILEADAQWNMAARAKIEDLLPHDKDAVLEIGDNDLPLMERISTEMLKDPDLGLAYTGRIKYQGVTVTPDQLRDFTVARKMELRDELMTSSRTPYVNEHKLEKILNVDEEFAMGVNSTDGMLMGIKDFNKPELHRIGYKHRTPEDYTGAAISMQGFQYRDQIIDQQREIVAAELLEDSYQNFTEVPWDKIYGVGPTSQRTSLVGALRPEFGSLREFAQYIGKQTTQALHNIIQRVDEDYVKHYDTFNRSNATGIRHELAQIDNLARRDWYYHGSRTFRNPDTGEEVTEQFLVNKHEAIEGFNRLNREMGGELGEWSPDYLENMPMELWQQVAGKKRNGNPATVTLSDEVSDFVKGHIGRNKRVVNKKRRLASLSGREAVYDENVFYTPPRNLRKEKFNAFVIPSAAQAGSDPRQFMVFGATQAEFNAKIDLIAQKYGKKYKVITQEERSQYARLMGDYDKDMVFDEMFFDSEVARKGTASELIPNMDLTSSSTLDRYREWNIRQEESLFRNGVEKKYGKLTESLKRLDKEYGKVGRTSLEKRYQPQDTIYKDTLNIMTGQRGYGSMAEQEFVRVNDFIGKVGGEILDRAFDALRPGRSDINLTDANMAQFNKQLADAGLETPTLNAVEAISASPKIKDSSTLRQLIRTLSNFTSLGMLRMDWAHSMLQVMSTPILGMPVLQEMQRSLRGTRQGQQLENMTTVVNPSSGAKEPSPYKLFAEGTQKFFTDEGKEFLKDLRSRNIVSDYLIQYLDTLDFSSFNGNHTLQQISAKTDQIAQRLSKVSLFTQSEEMTRFQVAWAAKRIGEIGGMSKDDMWPMINSTVDKIHGVYVGSQRPQFFQGALGQAVGLYQTYFFNFMQNMMKFYQGGESKSLMTLAGMQSSIFGMQSWTGFDQLNQLIGETNSENLDLFNVTNADDPNSTAAYFMYGLGSHALGFPIDFYSRGDLSVRHPTVLPTSVGDFPVVSTMAKAGANIYNTGKMAFGGDVPVGEALLHGLANNGLNRPLQGFANIMRNRVTSANGQIQWDDTSFTGDSIWDAEEIHWSGMFARAIGAKPLNESITANAYYRDAAYDANYRRELTSIGKKIQLNISSGNMEIGNYRNFLRDYESIGGEPQQFNAYWMRQLQNARKPVMQEFRREVEADKAYERIMLQRSSSRPWENETSIPEPASAVGSQRTQGES